VQARDDGLGTPAGANTTNTTVASKPGNPDSDMVGNSGPRPRERFAPEIAAPRIVPT
jgi:hypothetical protein